MSGGVGEWTRGVCGWRCMWLAVNCVPLLPVSFSLAFHSFFSADQQQDPAQWPSVAPSSFPPQPALWYCCPQ